MCDIMPRPDYRLIACALGARGKSGQCREGQSLMTTGREPRESATETKLRNVLLLVRRDGEKSGVRVRNSVW
jgi:hypothetical protein